MIEGLKIKKTIQSTDRFDSYEAELDGQKIFVKYAKGEKPRELLARVPTNSEVANKMGQRTAFSFRTPHVYKQNADWIVTEWIEGGPLSEKVDTQAQFVADALVNFLLIFDQETVINGEVRKTFKSGSLSDYMVEKLPKNLRAEQSKVLTDAKKLFDELQSTLTPAWQDGDIKPEHIFADPKNTSEFVLIDPEHLDQRWPRFYSLAYNFVKYWVRGHKEFSTTIANTFMRKSDVSEKAFFCPFLASVIVRGISLHWEPDYDPGAEAYNIPRAQELLKICLAARNLDDLTST